MLPRQTQKMSNEIKWFENPAFDVPHLNSPQPCVHGSGCVFTVKNAQGKAVPACCRFVHPGEEGTGRRLFPHTGTKSACVRLIGRAGFYERQRLRMPWQEWCARQGIPFTANKPGERHPPVKRIPIGGRKPVNQEESDDDSMPALVPLATGGYPEAFLLPMHEDDSRTARSTEGDEAPIETVEV
jgi:hypothetical protein